MLTYDVCQVNALEEERRQFNRFREDALRKHAGLS
jgi:hypothetical protein